MGAASTFRTAPVPEGRSAQIPRGRSTPGTDRSPAGAARVSQRLRLRPFLAGRGAAHRPVHTSRRAHRTRNRTLASAPCRHATGVCRTSPALCTRSFQPTIRADRRLDQSTQANRCTSHNRCTQSHRVSRAPRRSVSPAPVIRRNRCPSSSTGCCLLFDSRAGAQLFFGPLS